MMKNAASCKNLNYLCFLDPSRTKRKSTSLRIVVEHDGEGGIVRVACTMRNVCNSPSRSMPQPHNL